MRTLAREKPGVNSMLTLSKRGGPKRTTGFLEKPKPSRGMPMNRSSFRFEFSS